MRWLLWLLPSIPPPDDRVSVWSVSPRDARVFFRIAGGLWLAALGVLGYKERKDWSSGAHGWWDAIDLATAVLMDFGALVVALAAVAMLLARAATNTGDMLMSFSEWIKNRYVIPVIEANRAEAHAQGHAQGRAEARAEASAETDAKWRAWYDRRLAERGGREFDEPPPDA